MDYKTLTDDQARTLLEKYWQGESSLKEEQLLKDYFANQEVASDLLKEQKLFQFYNQEAELKSNYKVRTRTVQPRWYQWRGIAAAVVVLIAVVFTIKMVMPGPQKTEIREEVKTLATLNNEEKKAYNDAKAALQLVSAKLNKGKNAAVNTLTDIRK